MDVLPLISKATKLAPMSFLTKKTRRVKSVLNSLERKPTETMTSLRFSEMLKNQRRRGEGSNMELLKECTTCHEDFPATEDHFRKQAKNKDGLKYTCKTCDNNRAKKRYREKANELIANQLEYNKKRKDKYLNYQRDYKKKRRQLDKLRK